MSGELLIQDLDRPRVRGAPPTAPQVVADRPQREDLGVAGRTRGCAVTVVLQQPLQRAEREPLVRRIQRLPRVREVDRQCEIVTFAGPQPCQDHKPLMVLTDQEVET